MVSGLVIGLLIIGGIVLFNIGGFKQKLNIPILDNVLSIPILQSVQSLPILNLSAFDIRKAAVSSTTQSGSFVQQVDEEGRPVATFGTGF